MAAPQLGLAEFFSLARALGLSEVEIRNDIAGKPILDGTAPAVVKAAAEKAGVTIITINALQRFNDWDASREREAIALADYARACGARALVLVPVNDGSGRGDGERQKNVETALRGLKPILRDRGIIGLVEPLGFAVCSLSRKSEAAAAINAVGGDFRLVHDTFHHHLAGERQTFPALTGLVHISGVEDPGLRVADMRDQHRVLVGPHDRLGNVEQIHALRSAGYHGPFSFEPFAEELRHLPDPAAAIRASMDFIGTRIMGLAA
ncbi:MAG TPA: TIM barrel protein [Bauldia sp.]|nr:TIM barrel protein [Bauldia sp.]